MEKVKGKQIFQILLVVGIIVVLSRVFIIDTFIVKGDSMAPTIVDGDYVFVNKLIYNFREPKREEKVVLKHRSQYKSIK